MVMHIVMVFSRLVDKIIKILEFFILSVEILFIEKLKDLKNIGKSFEYFFRKIVFLKKIIRMFLKNINFY